MSIIRQYYGEISSDNFDITNPDYVSASTPINQNATYEFITGEKVKQGLLMNSYRGSNSSQSYNINFETQKAMVSRWQNDNQIWEETTYSNLVTATTDTSVTLKNIGTSTKFIFLAWF